MLVFFLTIFSGVAVYIIGQAILHFVLEPIKEFNKTRGEISNTLLLYRAKITNSSAHEEAQRKIKELASQLMASMWQIPIYNYLACIKILKLPAWKNVVEAAKEMNGISFAMGDSTIPNAAVNNYKATQKIADLILIQTSFD